MEARETLVRIVLVALLPYAAACLSASRRELYEAGREEQALSARLEAYDDNNMSTPVRLKYPNMESKYNSAAYAEAIAREPLNGKDDWHTKLWWDKFDGLGSTRLRCPGIRR